MDPETATSADRPASFVCTQCAASFGRLEHLQRHTASVHATERPFPCIFCTQAFTRRDVLLRHLKSCKARSDVPGSAPAFVSKRRGRKRKSCDTCIRQKRACSGTQPCLACVHRKHACQFTEYEAASDATANNTTTIEQWLTQADDSERVAEDDLNFDDIVLEEPAIDGTRIPDYALADQDMAGEHTVQNPFLESAPTDQEPRADYVGTSATVPRTRLAFLANFTSTKGLASSFDCGSVEHRGELIRAFESGFAHRESTDFHLTVKTHMIANAVKAGFEARNRRTSNGTTWTHTLEVSCCNFFAPARLRHFLACYWSLWHPNCTIIHKPTFSEEDAPAMLIAVMVLIGACLSPNVGDRESALVWLDPVEEWVFSAADFRDDPLLFDATSISDSRLADRLDALRTAYCVILLQTWEGSEEAKRRTRRSRYTDIIGVYRSVCSGRITHGDLRLYQNSPDPEQAWKRFVIQEELIRTLTYVVLLDAAYVIFNNTPPRMALREARIALACPEALFHAEDAETWEEILKIWAASGIGTCQPLISQVTSLLFTEQFSEQDWVMLQQMSTLNLFSLVHPLHVQLFHTRCHPVPDSQTVLIRRALENWKLIWLSRSGIQGLHEVPPMLEEDCWTRIGFAKHAFEFWCLADLILTSSETVLPIKFDQRGFVNESFIAQLLDRYDDSDMTQVNNLVNLFDSSMNLGM